MLVKEATRGITMRFMTLPISIRNLTDAETRNPAGDAGERASSNSVKSMGVVQYNKRSGNGGNLGGPVQINRVELILCL